MNRRIPCCRGRLCSVEIGPVEKVQFVGPVPVVFGASVAVTGLPNFIRPSQELSSKGCFNVDLGCPNTFCGGLPQVAKDILKINIAKACVSSGIKKYECPGDLSPAEVEANEGVRTCSADNPFGSGRAIVSPCPEQLPFFRWDATAGPENVLAGPTGLVSARVQARAFGEYTPFFPCTPLEKNPSQIRMHHKVNFLVRVCGPRVCTPKVCTPRVCTPRVCGPFGNCVGGGCTPERCTPEFCTPPPCQTLVNTDVLNKIKPTPFQPDYAKS